MSGLIAADLTEVDYAQWVGSYNGLYYGPGYDVRLVSLEGLRGLTQVRSGDVAKPRQYGSVAGYNELDERVVVATFSVFAPQAPFETVLASIANAFQNRSDPEDELPFLFQAPGWSSPRQVNCRPTAGGYPIDTDYQFNVAQSIPVQLTASDPLVYNSVVQTVGPVGLPAPTAGLKFPVTFPVTFGASTGGTLPVTNAGNETTYPVFTIAGPLMNPTLQLPSTGEFMSLTITLAAGDVLTVDMANELITLNGSADRGNTIVTGSSWFGFPPGFSSVGFGSQDSAQVAGTALVQFQDAWGWV